MTLFQWIGVFSIFALVIHIMAHACTETAKQMTPPFSNIFRQIGPKILGLPQVKFNCEIPHHDKQGYGNGAGRNRCHWNFQTFQRCNCLWPSDECLKSPSCLKSPYSTVLLTLLKYNHLSCMSEFSSFACWEIPSCEEEHSKAMTSLSYPNLLNFGSFIQWWM